MPRTFHVLPLMNRFSIYFVSMHRVSGIIDEFPPAKGWDTADVPTFASRDMNLTVNLVEIRRI